MTNIIGGFAFDPERYVAPQIYEINANQPGIIIGAPMDRETLSLLEERAEQLGRPMGSMVLNRKETDADGQALQDWFPLYQVTVISDVGNYHFELPCPVERSHIEEAEIFEFTRPELADLSEDDHRRNVIRISSSVALKESFGLAGQDIIPLYGGRVLLITSEDQEGRMVRDYRILPEDGAKND